MAALESPKNPALLVHAASFGISYSNALESLGEQLSSRGLSASASSEVSHGYAAIKFWLLLAQRVGDRESAEGRSECNSDGEQRRLWNEAWPSFEGLLNLSIMNNDQGSLVSFQQHGIYIVPTKKRPPKADLDDVMGLLCRSSDVLADVWEYFSHGLYRRAYNYAAAAMRRSSSRQFPTKG